MAIRIATRISADKGSKRFPKDSLGVKQVVWLGEGIVGDDTDGHIDDIARFVSAHKIVCVLEADPKDETMAVCATITSGCNAPRIKTERNSKSSRCLVPRRSIMKARACLPATLIFTLPTKWCWCRSSTTPMIKRRWEFSRIVFRSGK